MLLVELVRASADVARTRSRLTKRSVLADVLRRAPADELELVTTWLSGTLRQRRTGIGWRSLSDLPSPAAIATVSVRAVDEALDRASHLEGPGSAADRHEIVFSLFSSLTSLEQDFLRNLITGQVRQGALDSLVLDAIAEAANLPAGAVRSAAQFSAPTGPIALAALTGGLDALASFTLQVGRPVRPMLAAAAPDVTAAMEKVGSGGVIVDTKLDGIRIQVHRHHDEVQVFTRSLDEISERLPEIVTVARSLPVDRFILDGEALLVDADGRPRSFQETASRTASGPAESSLRPFFFDLLHLGDDPLLTAPLVHRLNRLDELVPVDHRVPRLETSSAASASNFFAEVIAAGQEGVILKDPGAPYSSGRRGASWVKVKPRHTFDLVVLAVEWGSGRRKGWLSNIHLGARGPEGFVMLGKTFKGMTDEMLAWQTERFLSLETHREGHVVFVRPEQVVEVAIDGLQRSTRYPGGVALRFARVLRYRDDKRPEEADTIATLRTLLPKANQ